ncbi:6-carboxytetrahydropterin synthase QueD [Pedobacter metabolipauper]|uniref:6-carboxy-5,6,7,8-tetrahydropterin synthase n=1 Tax=Pedobacter metabolipauper TaxID=425513 RepID=A0A4R6T4B4_9SPHI|nr:6-carboxytetrahydropterin synthase QueD [Pedobacter metabolipauper]TDQ12789.1 6-pyruvoyltetrahydropterin/6-carboxytetrahydropterin synthase [Pedobacter metabolipauper]
MIIYKTFQFDSAHYLPHVPKGHKCGKMHGHTYMLKIFISGTPELNAGWVLDYKDLKEGINPIINLLDHNTLNEIPGLENPTSENLCIWLWNIIKPIFPGLIKIELNETPTSGVIYEG